MQKTSFDVRIIDWGADVCSSGLQFVIVADDMIGAQLLGRPVEEAKADDDARRRRGLCRHDVIDAVADERRAAAAALLDHRQDRGGGGLALARPQRGAADYRGRSSAGGGTGV